MKACPGLLDNQGDAKAEDTSFVTVNRSTLVFDTVSDAHKAERNEYKHRTTRSSANAMSSQDAKDKEIARLKTELAKATVVYEQAQKQLESISTLHRTQAVTISSQIDTIRELIRLHPEDIPDIQGRAKAAEEERLRIVKDSSVKQETPASPE
ncbi:hypothetical protein A1F94_008022 [Pyrenophora tritici-repentis]|nr:hypothetical protein A1F94_008022 [Pyrenophora tritici-repentis]KAI1562237.1 hypothetical protein PtrEW7m1_011005 [Pyrenophora tritici-repentis]KAI1593566.1 hypothetical protein PtrEW13061_002950 [Pyrenophora tritici-repentis]PZC96804.1 hypothetical protein A1F95_05117 [Pyrenophora tritici-repentis]PZD25898.1 hypothetical protein A1F96_08057 [Pyrenophora tritici-repentis]